MRMKSLVRLLKLSLIALTVLSSILFLMAEDQSDPDKSAEEEGVRLLEQGGKVYLKEKKMEIPGLIAHSNMPLELLACAEGGKDYESLVVLKCRPHNIHLALTVFGLKQGQGPKFFGDPAKPTGDLILIFIEWAENDKTVCYRAEDLIIDLRTGKPMPRGGWVFTGSKFEDELDFDTGKPTGRKIFLANATKTIISTYHDPAAILDNPTESGGVGNIYEPNRKLLPEKMTPVKVTIRLPNEEELEELKKINEGVSKWEKEWREKQEKERREKKEQEKEEPK